MQPLGKFAKPALDRSRMPVSRDSNATLAICPGSPISTVPSGVRSSVDSGGGGGPGKGAGGGGGGAAGMFLQNSKLFRLIRKVK